MAEKPRDQNGQFVSTETVESEDEVNFYIHEFEARVIASRLGRAEQRYNDLLGELDAPINLSQDCSFWKKRFDKACSTRDKCDGDYYENGEKRHVNADNYIQIKMTTYECWSLGNRLYEVGNWFEEKGYTRIAQETQWLARRFHAEEKEVRNND